MHFIRIWASAILCALVYAIAQGQVTARLSGEYFTVGHRELLGTTSPALLAFAWSVIAAGPVGAVDGLFIALAARAGSRPRLGVTQLLNPAAFLACVVLAAAATAFATAFVLSNADIITLQASFAGRVPASTQDVFVAVVWANYAACAAALVGTVTLSIAIWRRRGRIATGSRDLEKHVGRSEVLFRVGEPQRNPIPDL